jgi:hypothetical protein
MKEDERVMIQRGRDRRVAEHALWWLTTKYPHVANEHLPTQMDG